MRYVVLMFLCSIAVIAYVQRTSLSAVKKLVCDDVGISTEEFGLLGSTWLVGYAIMQVPSGWLADRWGGRNVLVLLAIIWSLLTGAVGWCTNFAALLVLWFMMGMALAGIFPCAAKSIGAWFPDTEKALASGLLGSATMLGNAAASLLTVWLVFELDLTWQQSYLLYGIVGVGWALAYLAAIPERMGPHRAAEPMTADDWRRMVKSVPMWLICGQQFFRAGAMIFFINWFPIFLNESRGIELRDAGVRAFYVGIAAMTGGILGGFFSDWLLRRTGLRRLSRQGIAVFGMSAAAVLVLITHWIADNDRAVAILGLAGFVASFGGVSGYTVTIEFGGRRIGVVFSLMNMAGNVGGAIVNFAVASLTQRTDNWGFGLLLIVSVFAIDAVCWALLNPKGPLFPEQPLAV
jgi:sugar phosphate permease